MKKSVAVFGKGRVARLTLDILISSGYEIRYVVPTKPEHLHGVSFETYARDLGLNVLDVSNLDDLPKEKIDFGLSVYFNKIFKQRHIDRFGKLLNVHNAPLPKYRGVLPVNWALLNGEQIHGVTLHEIELGIDTGLIVDQITFPVDPKTDEVIDVYGRCLDFAEAMVKRTIPLLDNVMGQPQDHQYATYHSRFDTSRLKDRKFWRRGDESLVDLGYEL